MHFTPWRVVRLLSPLLPFLYGVFQWHPAIRPDTEWAIVLLAMWVTFMISADALSVIVNGRRPDKADRIVAQETARPKTWHEIEKTVAQLINSDNFTRRAQAAVTTDVDKAEALRQAYDGKVTQIFPSTGRFELAEIPLTQPGRHRADDTEPRLFTHDDDDLFGGRDRG